MPGVAALDDSVPTAENPCRTKPDGTVEIFDFRMEAGRPYPFQVDGWWFVAVKTAGASRAGIYYVEENAGGVTARRRAASEQPGFVTKALTRLFHQAISPSAIRASCVATAACRGIGLIAIHFGDDRVEIWSPQAARRLDPGLGNVLGLY